MTPNERFTFSLIAVLSTLVLLVVELVRSAGGAP